MYRNLNQLTNNNLQIKYNNTWQLNNSVAKQLNTSISFSYKDLNIDAQNRKISLIVTNRVINSCVIKCPNGEILDNLDYFVLQNGNVYDTVFDFSYVSQQWWDKVGQYLIIPTSLQKGVCLCNSNSNVGIQLLNIDGSNYRMKKMLAGNGISILSNDKQVVIHSGQVNCYSQARSLDNNGTIDVRYGNLQIFYTYQDSLITDIIYTLQFQGGSDSSNSFSTADGFQNVLCVNVILYKPNQTKLSYKENIILNKYDIGWFSFVIKKIFGKIFIGQPSRIITDYVIQEQ